MPPTPIKPPGGNSYLHNWRVISRARWVSGAPDNPPGFVADDKATNFWQTFLENSIDRNNTINIGSSDDLGNGRYISSVDKSEDSLTASGSNATHFVNIIDVYNCF
ncbi:MAG: hypothetical protein ACNYPH_05005 [Gammaproteobacteria bacterium WSBS_2016_MAG_OTU1]